MQARIDCPYCGEPFETAVDTSAGSQDYIEDCPVCCRPIEFRLQAGLGQDDYTLVAHRDDD
ncbi:MAG: CPXCG motif-containing cysteine-rich protein [Thiohalobacterales bacterium]|nr:CPXCG motif-containing cysteine-rich protein [Thiohalobacterales bacterium]